MSHPRHLPLRELYVSADAASALEADARKLPGWTLDAGQAGELTLLLNGGLAPLRGYMAEAEWRAACDGHGSWPVPLALRVGPGLAQDVQPGDDIALRDAGGGTLAVMSVTDRWGDPVLLGGKVKGLRRPAAPGTPNGLRALFRDRGIGRVLAVQPDRADRVAPAVRLAARLDALLLIQPWPGVVIEPPSGAILSPLPVAPPPGPRSALWQGLVARNHGATHLVLDGDAEAWDLYPQDAIAAPRAVPGDAP